MLKQQKEPWKHLHSKDRLIRALEMKTEAWVYTCRGEKLAQEGRSQWNAGESVAGAHLHSRHRLCRALEMKMKPWMQQRMVNDSGHRLGRGHLARGHACETAASSGADTRTHGGHRAPKQPCEDKTQAFPQGKHFWTRAES